MNVLDTTIDIALNFDDKYVKPAVITMNSIVKNRKELYKINFHILHIGLSSVSESYIRTFFSDTKDLSFNFINLKNEIEAYQTKLNKLNAHFTLNALLRIFLPKLFPSLTKLIYLDADLIANKDIIELYNSTQIDNKALSAVQDEMMSLWIKRKRLVEVDSSILPYFAKNEVTTEFDKEKNAHFVNINEYLEKYIGINDGRYFNSGVLVLNCKFLVENGYENKLLNGLEKPYIFPDQCLLNEVLYNVVDIQSDVKWNKLAITYRIKDIPHYPLEQVGILHFTTPHKPWLKDTSEVKQELVKLYMSYAQNLFE